MGRHPAVLLGRDLVTTPLATSAYVLVAFVSFASIALTSFFGGGIALTGVLLLAQGVFLVPQLRCHLQPVAVWTTVAVSAAVSGVVLLYLGSYVVVDPMWSRDPSPTVVLRVASIVVAATAPALAITTGSVVVGLSTAAPLRWRTVAAVGIGFLAIVISATLFATTPPVV